MDYAAFHPYPNPSAASEAPDKGLQWPNAGVPNIDRLQQAFWDAFHGTGQPLFAEGTGGDGLRWIFDESGWQTGTRQRSATTATRTRRPPASRCRASSTPSDRPLRMRRAGRDAPLLPLVDEADRDRMQTGLVSGTAARRRGRPQCGTRSPQGCRGPVTSWTHTTKVVGAASGGRRRRWFSLEAEEDFTYRASLVRLGGSRKAPAPSSGRLPATGRRTGRSGRGSVGSRCVRAATPSRSRCGRLWKPSARRSSQAARSHSGSTRYGSTVAASWSASPLSPRAGRRGPVVAPEQRPSLEVEQLVVDGAVGADHRERPSRQALDLLAACVRPKLTSSAVPPTGTTAARAPTSASCYRVRRMRLRRRR